MDHQEIEEKILRVDDAELSIAERREITEHLGSCEACRKILKNCERTRFVIQAAVPTPSEHFVAHVMGRLTELERQAERAEPRISPILKWLVPAIGYGFAVFLMFVAIAYREPAVNTEDLLLADVPQTVQWVFVRESPEVNKLLNAGREI